MSKITFDFSLINGMLLKRGIHEGYIGEHYRG